MRHTLEVSSPAIPEVRGRPALVPIRLSGNEGLNRLFEYELVLQTCEAVDVSEWDLQDFIGRPLQCRIQLGGAGASAGDAGVREINALITQADHCGREGRQERFRLVLKPWMHLATLGSNCRIFQNETAVQTLDEVLSVYPYPVEKRLAKRYSAWDFRTQYNESDFEFFLRLTQEHGIHYWFEHAAGVHTLVLADNLQAYREPDNSAYREVDVHPVGHPLDTEYFHRFVTSRRLAPQAFRSRDQDYARPQLTLDQIDHRPDHAGRPLQERLTVYRWHASAGSCRYAQPQAGTAPANDPHALGDAFARLRLQALLADADRANASGNLRGMVAGRTFALKKHLRGKLARKYLVLETGFLIEDVGRYSQMPAPAAEVFMARSHGWRVSVDLVAHPLDRAFCPAVTQGRPPTLGLQTARVVGPEGESLHTDLWGRIKVQFPWDRHGLRNQRSSCWLRVATAWAGNQMGAVHIPRVGQEVLVGFMNGDVDHPVCLGQVPNSLNPPPWALPGQSALSGLRSRELTPEGGGNAALGRSNHLVFDDTEGQMQVQLKSDHQHSQLSLGNIRRIEDHQGRKDARGEGFELRSDGHGVLRAGAGLLLSTEARRGAAGPIKSLEEAAGRLASSRDLQRALADSARQAGAQQFGDQDEAVKHLGTQDAEIRGGKADAVAAPSRHFPELAQPHLALASAAGISSTSTGATHIASGGPLALAGGGHASVSAGKSFLASARDAIRMFAFRSGMRLIAAGGDVEIKALQASIALLAQLRITLQGEVIEIHATKEVLINGGGSYVRINAAGITPGTLGAWQVHAGQHLGQGEDSLPVRTGQFPPPALHDEIDRAFTPKTSI